MKIFMPIITATLPEESPVGAMLHTPFACIYNPDGKNFDVHPHSGDINTIGDTLVSLKAKGINTIITDGMPLLTYMLCIEMGISIFKAQKGSTRENIEWIENNKLECFTARDTRIDNDCLGACSGCASNCAS